VPLTFNKQTIRHHDDNFWYRFILLIRYYNIGNIGNIDYRQNHLTAIISQWFLLDSPNKLYFDIIKNIYMLIITITVTYKSVNNYTRNVMNHILLKRFVRPEVILLHYHTLNDNMQSWSRWPRKPFHKTYRRKNSLRIYRKQIVQYYIRPTVFFRNCGYTLVGPRTFRT